MAKEQKITRMLWHEFTDEELKDLAKKLAMALDGADRLEYARVAANKDFRDAAELVEKEVRALTRAIQDGRIQEAAQCMAEFHTPQTGRKRIVRLDTGELVAEEAMTLEECQEHLFAEGAGA